MELQRITGWHDNLIKLLEDGKPFATACAFAQVPAARVFNAMDNDAEFKKRVEAAKRVGKGEGLSEGESGGAISATRVAPIA